MYLPIKSNWVRDGFSGEYTTAAAREKKKCSDALEGPEEVYRRFVRNSGLREDAISAA